MSQSKLTVEEQAKELAHNIHDEFASAFALGETIRHKWLEIVIKRAFTTLQTQHAIDVSEAYAQGWNEGQQALGTQHREEVMKVANQIGECLAYCEAQNGIPECKNCGLTLKMYQDLTKPN